MIITGKAPTYEDAQLVLKLYEIRREEKLRAARDWYMFKFFPETFDDIKAVLNPENPENASFRMVIGYWEMASSFVAHGVLHPELLLESSGELILAWAKLAPFIEEMRKHYNLPDYLKSMEQLIKSVPWAAERVANLQRYYTTLREQRN